MDSGISLNYTHHQGNGFSCFKIKIVTEHALPGPQNPALFLVSPEGNLPLVDIGIERFNPLLFITKTLLRASFLLFKEFCSHLAQLCQNILYTCLSCCSNNAFTLHKTGNIKYIQDGEIRKTDCQDFLCLAKSPRDNTVGDVFYSFWVRKIRSSYQIFSK